MAVTSPPAPAGEKGRLGKPVDLVKFLLGCFAVWRITHLVVAEEGPYEMFAKLRGWAAGGILGGILSCFYCASIWVAAPIAILIGGSVTHILLSIAGYSGAAILLERATAPTPTWIEETTDDITTNNSEGVLRSDSGNPSFDPGETTDGGFGATDDPTDPSRGPAPSSRDA